MINYKLIQELYQSLKPNRKRELLHALFGEGNQTIAYFKNGRDSRFSKIETMSDFFGVPIDTLRQDSRYTYNNKTQTLNYEKPSRCHEDVLKIELLEERIKLLQDALAIKEEHIQLLLEKNEFYKSHMEK